MNNKRTQRTIGFLAVIAVLLTFGIFAMASGESDTTDSDATTQGTGIAEKDDTASNLENYRIDILSCRLATDYEGKPIAIIKYAFTNNANEPASFYLTFEDKAYQNGVSLNTCYVVDDNVEYLSDNKTKEIKKGATLEIEEAYVLNDTTSDIEVEISQLFSFNDKTISKTFKIAD